MSAAYEAQQGRPVSRRTPVQKASRITAAVLLVLGLAGFIPGIVANYGELSVTGNGPDGLLVGLLPVSVMHNVLLILFAAVLWAASRSVAAAKSALIVLAVVNWLLAGYGLLNERGTSPYWVPSGAADNWFHLVLGLVLFGLGLIRGPKTVGDRKG